MNWQLAKTNLLYSPIVLAPALAIYYFVTLLLLPKIPLVTYDTGSYLFSHPIRNAGYCIALNLILSIFHNPYSIVICQLVVFVVSLIIFCAILEAYTGSVLIAVLMGLLLGIKDGSLLMTIMVGSDSCFESALLLLAAASIALLSPRTEAPHASTPVTFPKLLFFGICYYLCLWFRPAAIGFLPGLALGSILFFKNWKDRIRLIATICISMALIPLTNFVTIGQCSLQKQLGNTLFNTAGFLLDSQVRSNYPEITNALMVNPDWIHLNKMFTSAKSELTREAVADTYACLMTYKIAMPIVYNYLQKSNRSQAISASTESYNWNHSDEILFAISIDTFKQRSNKLLSLTLQRALDYIQKESLGLWVHDLAHEYRVSLDNPDIRGQGLKLGSYKYPSTSCEVDVFGLKHLLQSKYRLLNFIFCFLSLLSFGLLMISKKHKSVFLLSIAAFLSLPWWSYMLTLILTGSYQPRYFEVACSWLMASGFLTLCFLVRCLIGKSPSFKGYLSHGPSFKG